MDRLFNYFIKNPFVRAQILAGIRHLITSAGVGLIAHGYVDKGMVEAFAGFVTVAASFYLSQQDVKSVDTKITTALLTPPPVTVENAPDVIKEEVKELDTSHADMTNSTPYLGRPGKF